MNASMDGALALCYNEAINSRRRAGKKEAETMVTGHLQEKSGRFYMVISTKDENGKRIQKWKTTGLTVKGNRRQAESMLRHAIVETEAKLEHPDTEADGILFADYMLAWLETVRSSVEESTFTGYRRVVQRDIAPYFRKLGVTLGGLRAKHIQAYYMHLMVAQGASPASVRRQHANIRTALQQAFKTDMILSNPADKVDKPRQRHYIPSFYDEAALNRLLECARGTRHHLAIMVAAYYGLRRSEVLGLKWDALDFRDKTLTVRHTVTMAGDGLGHQFLVQKDRAKNRASHRTLPLIPQVEAALLVRRAQIEENRALCGDCYCHDYDDYVFVNDIGRLLKPEYLSRGLAQVIEQNGLKKIRLHDLRHSCATLLLRNGISMKAIQEWLGHSSYATTANIYAHLDYDAKKESAAMIASLLSGGTQEAI